MRLAGRAFQINVGLGHAAHLLIVAAAGLTLVLVDRHYSYYFSGYNL
jgi:hypothetical protein